MQFVKRGRIPLQKTSIQHRTLLYNSSRILIKLFNKMGTQLPCTVNFKLIHLSNFSSAVLFMSHVDDQRQKYTREINRSLYWDVIKSTLPSVELSIF